MTEQLDALVIGAGPAGLMAAHELALAGRKVVIVDAKPSVGRKFLMAGKSGLNLTKDEPLDQLLPHYAASADRLRPMLTHFDPAAIQNWAIGLGQPVFTGTSGRVFPTAMKASPLLRAWLEQLRGLSVDIRPRHHWTGWDNGTYVFDVMGDTVGLRPKVTVLALGGASWSRLGSDGKWTNMVEDMGAQTIPFAPSNVGLAVQWSPFMTKHFGQPIKGVALHAGNVVERGEFVITEPGLEGGGIYAMSAALRDGHPLFLDLMPDWSINKITMRLNTTKSGDSMVNRLRKALRLDPAKLALLMEFARPLPDIAGLATIIKRLPVQHTGFRPMDQAISTVGGIAWDSLDEHLMVKSSPGTFVAGEMIDWDAPTGGYLLTACLATGKWAGQNAAGWQ